MTRTIGRRATLAGLTTFAASAATSVSTPSLAKTDDFPAQRVTLVVPFPPGASTDVTMRVMADKLTQMWGQPVIVDNKGGGNGIIAAEAVKNAKPDGYTLLATSSMTHAGNPSLYDKLPYDPIADYEPVTRMSLVPMAVLVTRKLGVKTLGELTARLKAEPGKHNYGSGAISARVAGELYKMLAGVDAVYVGYKNNQLAAPDLNNGIISFMICDVGSAKMILNSGWADALAVTQAEPYPQLPGVPSAVQAGMPELLFTTWSAFYVPKGTPRDVVLKLNKDIIAAGTAPEIAAKLDSMAGGPNFTTPEGLMEFTKSEIVAWRKVIRAANIKVE
jgi:tripartite-type tricarboxylate transporter receptor subunit TctC